MNEKIKQLIKEIKNLEENQDFVQHLNKIRDKKNRTYLTKKRMCS